MWPRPRILQGVFFSLFFHRPTCSVDVSNLVQQVPEACDRDYRNFVDVSYTCVDGKGFPIYYQARF